MDSKEEDQKQVETKKEEKITILNILSYAAIGAIASIVFFTMNSQTARITPDIATMYRINRREIRDYEDSIYRIVPDREYDTRYYYGGSAIMLSFILVFGLLYLVAMNKLNIWEIIGFTIVSILLGFPFFLKYFLKKTANVFPGDKNPYTTYYREGSEKEVASANAVLFGVPVAVFLTNVAVLFGLFYAYVSIFK